MKILDIIKSTITCGPGGPAEINPELQQVNWNKHLKTAFKTGKSL